MKGKRRREGEEGWKNRENEDRCGCPEGEEEERTKWDQTERKNGGARVKEKNEKKGTEVGGKQCIRNVQMRK